MKKTTAFTRKRQTRKPLDRLAGMALLNRARPYEPGEMDHEHELTEQAFTRLRTGTGGEADFDRVSMLLNVGLIRGEDIAPEIVSIMQAGQMAMGCMKNRFLKTQRFTFDALGLEAADYALETYRTVMDSSSPLQMIQAIRQAYKRITAGDLLEMPA